VLVDSKGFTLYHINGETPSKIICTASCVTIWPPLKASGTPTGGSGATGTLSDAMRPDGISQVTYDGMTLYTFSGDTQPGQANGEGIMGKWFAVTPAGKPAGANSGGSTTGGSTSGGGGRYGY
jgi:predicted lipoprotein with Yx(FWY)xxD motif